ncbi:hypothetical protein B0A53_05831 [Rhodotorula sp. CCFEE 5036]|nr:hypothetical protein B0A53_05831 [Rhodotorula sp. CCFEE 5036]
MQNAYRTGPTLETIPTELKLEIASHLDPDVPLDSRWSEMAQHEAQSRRPVLRSLSLVSRSWAAALAELRWQTLHLRLADTERLLELARDFMPRYGAKIKKLVLVWWTIDDLSDLCYRSDTPSNSQLEALEASERFTGLRALLHFKVVDRMTTRTLEFKKGSKITISSSRTKNALQELGSRISSVDFSSADLFFGYHSATASRYLDIFANVEHLSVRVDDDKPSALDLQDLQVTELANILKVHPITSLCLRDLSIAGFQLPPSLSAPRPGSIKVKNLSIAGRTDGALLDLFDGAPLKHVELCARRSGRNSARFSSQRIKAFIKKHCASLLTFKADRLFFDAAELSAINRALEQEGVPVRVITVK